MLGFLEKLFRTGGSGNAWIDEVCDRGSFRPLFADLVSADPLGFPGYREKLDAASAKHPDEGIAVGEASILGFPVCVGSMQTEFIMGSMGSVVGEKIVRIAERAAETKTPLVLVSSSGGARMQEGLVSLMQMAKTSAAVKRLRNSGTLYVSVLAWPTTGGVAASFAMQGDVVLAEPDALVAFAGPRVIEQVMKQKLPEGFQSAKFTLEHGFVDRIVPRNEMRATLGRILELHGARK